MEANIFESAERARKLNPAMSLKEDFIEVIVRIRSVLMQRYQNPFILPFFLSL